MKQHQTTSLNKHNVEQHEHTIGKRLKEARKKQKITQSEVAELLGVTKQTISNYETGNTYPPEKMLAKLCELYEVEPHIIKGNNSAQQDKTNAEIIKKIQYIKNTNYENDVQCITPFNSIILEEDWLREQINSGIKNLNKAQLRQLKDMILAWSLINI